MWHLFRTLSKDTSILIKHRLFIFNIVCILVFAAASYHVDKYLKKKNIKGYNEHLTWFNAVYHSIVTQTTVGFGDITPKTFITRLLVVLQCFCILASLYLF